MTGVGRLSVNGQVVYVLVAVGQLVSVTVPKCTIAAQEHPQTGISTRIHVSACANRSLFAKAGGGLYFTAPAPCQWMCVFALLSLLWAKETFFRNRLIPIDSILKV